MTDEQKRGGDESPDPKAPGAKAPGPKVLGKEALRPALPKRFYKVASVEPRGDAFGILLDGRAVRTPRKRELAMPVRELADAIAVEWNAQREEIDPATMPLTRIANSALDGVAEQPALVVDDIVAFAGSDLLCYRAETPEALIQRQAEAWDPILAWARRDLGATFIQQTGVMPIEQPAPALAAIRRALQPSDALSLAALHVMTTISGSAILSLAHALNAISLENAWAAAIVDEVWQVEQWGRDAEADARSATRFADFSAASDLLALLRLHPISVKTVGLFAITCGTNLRITKASKAPRIASI